MAAWGFKENEPRIFQNYDALRHESTSINYILPFEGV